MKRFRYVIAVAALVFTVPAQANLNDSEIILYRVSGVVDSGGIATSIHCTNFSGVTENVRFVFRALNSALVLNTAFNLAHLNTLIVSTHEVNAYNDTNLNTGAFEGTLAIAATSTNITCTAMQVQSNITTPVGIALHMTRFNPIAGTQE